MKKLKAWFNGEFVDLKSAKVSVLDRGFLYGDGVFETMRAYTGSVFGLDEHLDRLFRSLKIMGIEILYDKDYMKDLVGKTLKVNSLASASVRIAVTRGEGGFGIGIKESFSPTIVITAQELAEYSKSMYEKGITAKVVDIRQNERTPISGIKSLNFLNYIFARLEAKRERFDEAILLNSKDEVVEAATSNLFIVKADEVVTPPISSGALPGVTRKLVLGIAKGLGIKAKEAAIQRPELLAADEVFLTNSLIEIVPVTRIDATRVGSGSPGAITKRLHDAYRKEVVRATGK